MKTALSAAWTALTLTWAVSGAAGEPLAEAKAKIAQCIERQGEEYIEARNWVLGHPEALELLQEDSWKERWLKRICQGWIENKDLYEREMKAFETAEANARMSVSVGVPSLSRSTIRQRCRRLGDRLAPLMVECLWKTGRNWRGYKAWRVLSVVEYLKMAGDASVLEPAVDVLVSRSSREQQTPEPGSEYAGMGPGRRAGAELVGQMAPYQAAQLVMTFGDESTLTELRTRTDDAQTAEASKRVLATTIKLLARRLEAKKQGLPLDQIELFDMCAAFGDRTTLENMRAVWGKGAVFHAERVRGAMANLEKRLQEEKKASKPD